jgi:hypothetical protein
MLKQFKIVTLVLTCFGSRRNHHQGAVLCLAKTTSLVFIELVGIDAVNIMAAYQPVVQVCGSQCCHNFDYVYTDEHSKTIPVVLAKHRTAP